MVRRSTSTQIRPERKRKPRLSLTPQALRALRPGPDGARVTYQDDDVRGLGLRVGDDSRTWVFSYSLGGKKHVMRLGDLDERRVDPVTGKVVPISLSDRREQARVLRGQVSSGVDPLEARRPSVSTATVADLARDWLKSREAAEWRPKTRTEIERIVLKYFTTSGPLAKMDPAKITRREIRQLLDGIEKDSVCDHARGVLRMLFSWAAEHDRIPGLPLFPAKRSSYVPRSRVLTDDELRSMWTLLDGGKLGLLGDAFKLMLLTAQRRGEVLGMTWAELKNEGTDKKPRWWWTIPGERTKNARTHRVPLADDAVAVLEQLRQKTGECAVVFPSPKDEGVSMMNPQKCAEKLWEASGVAGATLHDLRRTAAHSMARAGIPDAHVAAVLNHSGVRETSIVTQTYISDPLALRLDGAKRTAVETWERDLRGILTGKKGKGNKVVSITAGRAKQ